MAEKTPKDAKQPITEEERIALAEKLDKELDEFIASLEKKRYAEGWPEDKWEEEMDKHPFFMKSTPENGALSPLAEGLAKLKYDAEENTPVELAGSYKEDGNFNFKHKNYRMAIIGYTEGIKQRCDDAEMNASLYNNRAASHFQLKNYRSALFDSEKALTFNPDYTKARLRAAKAALEVFKFDICIKQCYKLLERSPGDEEVLFLLYTAKKRQLMLNRDQRKRERRNAKEGEKNNLVIKAIIERGIKVWKCDGHDDLDMSKLQPSIPAMWDAIVHITDGVLMWPVLFLVVEYKMTECIRKCPENVPLVIQVGQIFPAPWDKDNDYSTEKVNLYYEGTDGIPHLVADPAKPLADIIVGDYFEVKGGAPAFCVLPRGSEIERRFLASYVRPHMLK